jgi:hypothetical protein
VPDVGTRVKWNIHTWTVVKGKIDLDDLAMVIADAVAGGHEVSQGLPSAGIRNGDCRRTFSQKWLDVDMTEPLPLLIENSIEIAWDYLARTGELGDAMVAGRFLSDTIELMVRRGERRRLMLANKAIAAYQQFRRQQSVPPVLASA